MVRNILKRLGLWINHRDYRGLGDTKRAKELHERVLKIKEKYYGKEHIETAFTLGYLGSDYTALKKAGLGKSYLEESLKIKELYYGMEHPLVADTLMELGNAYKSLKDFKQAETHLKRAFFTNQRAILWSVPSFNNGGKKAISGKSR